MACTRIPGRPEKGSHSLTSAMQSARQKGSARCWAPLLGASLFAALVLGVALMSLPGNAIAQDGTVDGAAQRIVILNTTDPYLPAFVELDRAMREAIAVGTKAPVGYLAETLDMYRFPQADLEGDIVSLLRKKYHELKVDVVVAVAPIALDFALRHRDPIWPGASIVFHSVPTDALRDHGAAPDTIGVPLSLDYGPTVELALKLRPAARTIAVVAGAAEFDREQLSLARRKLKALGGRFDVREIVGQTLAETADALRSLPADAIVLFLTVFRDGAGGPTVPRDVLTRLAAVSPVPVFGVYETYLGHGIAAGSITSYAEQGPRAGELVVRLLAGETPAAIGVQAPGEPGCIADWRQLRRWGIDESALPAGCDIRFEELTTWDRYRWQILVVLAVILAQAAMIVALSINRRRLKHSRAALQSEFGRRTEAEALAFTLRQRLARFGRERSLGAMATAIAHEINQPLLAINNYAQAARRRLERDVEDKPRLLDLHAKIAAQAARAGDITQRIRSLFASSELRLARVPLSPLLEEMIRIMAPEAQNLGCQLEVTPHDPLPDVLADALQLQLVLANLLRNAMQSVCAGGQVDKRVSIEVRAIGAHEVQMSVLDRGPGVAPERVEEIFEPLSSSTSSGMGIGLALCRSIVDAHGGRLWYEPRPGGGAVFRFTLRCTET